MKLTGADGPWLMFIFTWQVSNFMFGPNPGPDVDVVGVLCGRALSSLHDVMTVNERIGYLTQLAAVCHWYVRTCADTPDNGGQSSPVFFFLELVLHIAL